MSDVSALEKQLKLKTNQIEELQVRDQISPCTVLTLLTARGFLWFILSAESSPSAPTQILGRGLRVPMSILPAF